MEVQMPRALLLSVVAITFAAAATATAQAPAAKKLVWGPAPDALPAGAKVAVVDGDPGKAGPFTIQLSMPSRYRIAPHSHPTDEHVKVLRGTIMMGSGNEWSAKGMHALKAGASDSIRAGTNHFVQAQGPTIIEVHSTGPFVVNYVNQADDPRTKKPKTAKPAEP
jgi:quercetin dioxygenase-like cupin family protein